MKRSLFCHCNADLFIKGDPIAHSVNFPGFFEYSEAREEPTGIDEASFDPFWGYASEGTGICC